MSDKESEKQRVGGRAGEAKSKGGMRAELGRGERDG